MKIAISSATPNLESEVDLRFGRAKCFIIYDINDNTFYHIDNVQNSEAAQGAGIQAAQHVLNENIKALITGHCGPKAFKVLSLAGIKIFTGVNGSIKENIEKYKNNKLEEALKADVESHWM